MLVFTGVLLAHYPTTEIVRWVAIHLIAKRCWMKSIKHKRYDVMDLWQDWRSVGIVMNIQDCFFVAFKWSQITVMQKNMETTHTFLKVAKLEQRRVYTYGKCEQSCNSFNIILQLYSPWHVDLVNRFKACTRCETMQISISLQVSQKLLCRIVHRLYFFLDNVLPIRCILLLPLFLARILLKHHLL